MRRKMIIFVWVCAAVLLAVALYIAFWTWNTMEQEQPELDANLEAGRPSTE